MVLVLAAFGGTAWARPATAGRPLWAAWTGEPDVAPEPPELWTAEQVEALEIYVICVDDGRTDQDALSRLGLTADQWARFRRLRAEIDADTLELYQMRTGHRERGLEINRKWTGGLQEILTPEQYRKYQAYWTGDPVVVTPVKAVPVRKMAGPARREDVAEWPLADECPISPPRFGRGMNESSADPRPDYHDRSRDGPPRARGRSVPEVRSCVASRSPVIVVAGLTVTAADPEATDVRRHLPGATREAGRVLKFLKEKGYRGANVPDGAAPQTIIYRGPKAEYEAALDALNRYLHPEWYDPRPAARFARCLKKLPPKG